MNSYDPIWPYDLIHRPTPQSDDGEGPFKTAFLLICPFTPVDVFNDLYNSINQICDEISNIYGNKIELLPVNKIKDSYGYFTEEIWERLKRADIIIADVTHGNQNVMYELGVVASNKRKKQVIIIKDKTDDTPFASDIAGINHILYEKTLSGHIDFKKRMMNSIIKAMASIPYDIIEGKTKKRIWN